MFGYLEFGLFEARAARKGSKGVALGRAILRQRCRKNGFPAMILPLDCRRLPEKGVLRQQRQCSGNGLRQLLPEDGFAAMFRQDDCRKDGFPAMALPQREHGEFRVPEEAGRPSRRDLRFLLRKAARRLEGHGLKWRRS